MARIKKIMQKDDEVGKIAQATPILISKCLEMFLSDLLSKTCDVTKSKNARVISITHLKQCILAEPNFDFLKDVVENVPDIEPERAEKRGRPRKGLTSSSSLKSSKSGTLDSEDEEELEEDEEEEDDDDIDDSDDELRKKKRKSLKESTSTTVAISTPQKPEKKRGRKPIDRSANGLTSSTTTMATPVIPVTNTSRSLMTSSGATVGATTNNSAPFSIQAAFLNTSQQQIPPISSAVPQTASFSPFASGSSPFSSNLFSGTPFNTGQVPLSSVLASPPTQQPTSLPNFSFSIQTKRIQESYEEEEEEEASGNIQNNSIPIKKDRATIASSHTSVTVTKESLDNLTTFPISLNSSANYIQTSTTITLPPTLATNLNLPPTRKSNMADLLRSSRDVEDYDFSSEFVVQPRDTV